MGPKKRATVRSRVPIGKIKSAPASRKTRLASVAPRTRKSKRSRSRSRSPSVSPSPKYIIYHENIIGNSASVSDSYRPIIIVNMPLFSQAAATKKTAFYKSSGRSNDKFKGLYSNTWVPFGGLLETEYKKEDKMHGTDQSMDYGFIIKMHSFSHIGYKKSYMWIYDLIIDYYRHISDNDIKKRALNALIPKHAATNTAVTNTAATAAPTLKFADKVNSGQISSEYYRGIHSYLNSIEKKDEEEIKYYKMLVDDYYKLHSLLHNYFLNTSQLYISAFIGGGYWEKNPNFREYIMNLNMPENVRHIADNTKNIADTIFVPTHGTTGENTAEVIAFLKENHAQYTPDELLENMPSNGLQQYSDDISSTIALINNKMRLLGIKGGGGAKRRL